jgi:hypothetical protein
VSRLIVVDASVVVDLLARFRPQPIEALLWAADTHLAAPELLFVEVLSALRKLDRVVARFRLAAVPSYHSNCAPCASASIAMTCYSMACGRCATT